MTPTNPSPSIDSDIKQDSRRNPEVPKQTSTVGTVETQYFEFAHSPDELILENGDKLGPITVAYETYGKLNAQRSNAILILHALSGDAHAAGFHKGDEKPGWWDEMIGPGKALIQTSILSSVQMSLAAAKAQPAPLPSTRRPGDIMVLISRSSAFPTWLRCRNIS